MYLQNVLILLAPFGPNDLGLTKKLSDIKDAVDLADSLICYKELRTMFFLASWYSGTCTVLLLLGEVVGSWAMLRTQVLSFRPQIGGKIVATTPLQMNGKMKVSQNVS